MRSIAVNGERLWANLQELRVIGGKSKGASRVAFSREDMEGRKWLLGKLKSMGLEPWMDEVGNVFAVLSERDCPCSTGGHDSEVFRGLADGGPAHRPAILIGSHLDTVPEGGLFDGALGVLASLECLETVIEGKMPLKYPIQLAAFSNEEGSLIGHGMLGSRFFAGEVLSQELKEVSLFLHEAGLLKQGAVRPANDVLCYLELHVEQGGILDDAGEDIGVVQGIVSISSFTATFNGKANHAGTTPMSKRKDALLAAAELALLVPRTVEEAGSGQSVGTCGQIQIWPCAKNVVPGKARMSVEVRDIDRDVTLRLASAIKEVAQEIADRRGLTLEIAEDSFAEGAAMDPRIQEIIWGAATRLGLKVRKMPSGAGHDAMVMARHWPCGMIFVPSRGGVSHSPDEWTSKESCVSGAQVLLEAVLAIEASGLRDTR